MVSLACEMLAEISSTEPKTASVLPSVRGNSSIVQVLYSYFCINNTDDNEEQE